LEDLTPIGAEGDMRLQPLYMAPLGSDPTAKTANPPPSGDAAARAADHLAKATALLTGQTREGSDEDAEA
jgi:hypothetical protein